MQFYKKRPITIRVAIAEYMLVYDWPAAEMGDFVRFTVDGFRVGFCVISREDDGVVDGRSKVHIIYKCKNEKRKGTTSSLEYK